MDQSLFDFVDTPTSLDPTPESTDGSGGDSPEATWSVTELHKAIEATLSKTFGDELWVEGEIRNLKRSKNKHVYFDLVDAESDSNYPPMLSVTLFYPQRQIVNRLLVEQGGGIRMDDGIRVRIRGRLNTYASRSSLQLRMSAMDPKFTLGVLDMMREKVRAALAADGLLDRNAAIPLSPMPTRVGMVTSVGSAAHADALHELESSGLGLQVMVFDARVQGNDAARSITSALRAAQHHGVDVILLVRGGGARTDLAAFDLEAVARAIALSTAPVFTGIGHEIDVSIADSVAHSCFKTPTAAASAVCDQVLTALREIEQNWGIIERRSTILIDRLDQSLVMTGTRLGRGSTRHINSREQALGHISHRIRFAAPTRLERSSDRLEDSLKRLSRAVVTSLSILTARISAFDAHNRAHDPQRALSRGWSITHDNSGHLVRSVSQVRPGQSITTRFADGEVQSVVSDVSEVSDKLIVADQPTDRLTEDQEGGQ